jgi:DNA-binding CsgD family transcriptional regulator
MSAASILRRRRDELVRQAQRGTSVADVFARSSARLRAIVPFDAAAWVATDPGTGLPTAPVRIDELDDVTHAMCSSHWQRELLLDDVNQFRSLARAPIPAAALRQTAPDPEVSARYRGFVRPLGFSDELRAVLRFGDATWATVTLWRREGRAHFDPRELKIMAGLSSPLAESLRRHARSPGEPSVVPGHDRPGVLLFDRDCDVMAVNDEARFWLSELPSERGAATAHGVEVPIWLLVTVYRADAIRHGAGDGTARTRVRTRSGRWLVCHASCPRLADGSIGTTVLVIEPAQPASVAPIVVEAYDLTDREQQIVRLIARGAPTIEIADELHLSPHTVRDHVKAIFSKAGVSSRGELTAKLFADFYEPLHAADVIRAHS